MIHAFPARRPRARRHYTCGYCEDPIPVGARHDATPCAGDGRVWTWRAHPICAAIVAWDIAHPPVYRGPDSGHPHGWDDQRIAGAWVDDDVDGWAVEPDELRAAVEDLAEGLTALVRGPT